MAWNKIASYKMIITNDDDADRYKNEKKQVIRFCLKLM